MTPDRTPSFEGIGRLQGHDSQEEWDVCKARGFAMRILQAAEFAETTASVRKYCAGMSDPEKSQAAAQRLLTAISQDREVTLQAFLQALLAQVKP